MNLWQIWYEWRQARRDRHLRARAPVLEEVLQRAFGGQAADAARQWRRWMRWRWEYDCDAHVRVMLDRDCGDIHDAEKVCRRRIWRSRSPRIRRQYITYLVELTLFHGRRDLMREAAAWTAELVADRRTSKRNVYRGAVLFELGRGEEALPYLHEAAEDSESFRAACIAAHYLAKLHHDRNEATLAREWLAAAEASDSTLPYGRIPFDLIAWSYADA